MENTFKRRSFLGLTLAALVGTPVALHLFREKKKSSPHQFSSELKRINKQIQLPIQLVDGPASFSLALAPPTGKAWKYMLFSPSYFPREISQAINSEPDSFLLREGELFVEKTDKGQVVFAGGDTISKIHYPTSVEERDVKKITLLADKGKLQLARLKGTQSTSYPDTQFLNLLTMNDLPKGELSVGKKWKSNIGRIKPFDGYTTSYEVDGFAEVLGRKTVQIRFAGDIPNLAHRPGVNAEKLDKNATMTNKHQGKAYFDLETGLLVRQEIEMTTTSGGIQEYVARDGSKELVIKANIIVQLFPV